jgi:mercuric ion transport protein
MTTEHLFSDAPRGTSQPQFRAAAGPLAALGGFAGLGALAASSCCVLPLALAGLGAGSAVFGGLELLGAYQPYLLGGALALLMAAWVAFWRRSKLAGCASEGACAKPGTPRLTAVILALATLSVGAAAGWGIVEPILLRAIQ